MNRRYLLMLVLLALVWGSSFMFIKVADRTLEPSTLILGRLGLAALVLAVFVPLTAGAGSTAAELRAHWRGLLVVGIVNTALPFWLLSWGETRLDSGLASIIQASVPLFFTLIAGAGPAYASLVTYLVPPVALAYGAVFLREHFGAAAFGGLALILVGVALGSRSPSRRARPMTSFGHATADAVLARRSP